MSPATDGPAGVHVVVLNWNRRDDTLSCVRSVLADGIVAKHLVVVDNGSHDGIEQALRSAHPDVTFVQTGANLGFTGGMNRGVRECLAVGARFVCVLNNDTQVQPGMFAALGPYAETGMAVSPEVRYLQNPDEPWFGAGVIDAERCWPRHLTASELAALDAADPGGRVRDSETLAGCCILASAATWRAVGPFDPAYFLLFEDADWSARARARGVPLVVARDAVLLHAVSASFTGAGALLSSYYYARNGMRFGRTRVTRHLAPRLRFARDQLVRPALRRIRRGEVRAGALEVLFILAGLGADGLRVYGPAPRAIGRAAGWLAGPASTRPTRPARASDDGSTSPDPQLVREGLAPTAPPTQHPGNDGSPR